MTNKLSPIPMEWLPIVQTYIQGFPSETRDFSSPHIRRSLTNIYPLFITLYALLGVVGILGNVFMARHIIHERLYRQSPFGYLLGLNFCYAFMSTVVLPLSLTVLLIHNWIFGSLLCYTMPMLQDFPFYVSVINILLLTINRYRRALNTELTVIPAIITIPSSWVLSIGAVFPYALYMKYLDLEEYLGKQFKNVGICSVWVAGSFAIYIRILSLLLFLTPAILIAIFHVKTGKLLDVGTTSEGHQEEVEVWNAREQEIQSFASSDCRDRPIEVLSVPRNCDRRSSRLSAAPEDPPSVPFPPNPPDRDFREPFDSFQLNEERSSQKFVGFIVMTSTLSLCPLTILRFAKNFALETESNSILLDVTFIAFVWVAFLPCAVVPILFYIWKCRRTDQLEGYFRFSTRKTRISCSNYDQEAAHSQTPPRFSLEPAPSTHAQLTIPSVRLGPEIPQIWTPVMSRPDKQFQRARVHSFNI